MNLSLMISLLQTNDKLSQPHDGLRYHLSKMKIIQEDTCRLCMEEVETAAYIVCSCPELASIRLRFIGRSITGNEHMSDLSLKNRLGVTRRSMELWELVDQPSGTIQNDLQRDEK